jgi:hypothetical protein
LQRAGSLIAARKEAGVCLRTCGDAGKKDCAAWLDEIDRAVPSIVISARRDGADVVDLKATIDGRETAANGVAVEVDPGQHAVVVRAGPDRVTSSILVAQGEKERRLVLTLPTAPSATAAPASPPHAPLRPSTIALGAVGIAGLVGFGVLSLYGNHLYSDLEACRGHCTEHDVNTSKSVYLAGDIMLLAGVAFSAAAIVTYLLSRGTPDGAATPSL